MTDIDLYQILEGHSKKLRAAAGDLLEVLEQMNGSSRELTAFKEALQKMQTVRIQEMAKVVLELNRHAQRAIQEIAEQPQSPQSLKKNQAMMTDFLKKSDQFVLELTQLTNTANKLKQKNPSALKSFGHFCARLVAGVVALPGLVGGMAIALAGGVATLGLWVPGLVVGSMAGLATKNVDIGIDTFNIVTRSVYLIGLAIMAGGATAAIYAMDGVKGLKEMEKIDPGPFPKR